MEQMGGGNMTEKEILMQFFTKWRRICAEREGCEKCPAKGKCNYGCPPERMTDEKCEALIDIVFAESGGRND